MSSLSYGARPLWRVRRLPQAVRHDQPQHGRADRQHGQGKQAKPTQGIRQHPKVRGNERKDHRRCGGRQRPRELNDQPPGPVGADHAGQEPHVPAHHRSDEAEINIVIRRFDHADRCRQRRDPITDPRASPRAALPKLETAISQPSRSNRARARLMASTPRLMSATAGSVRTGTRHETASDTRPASSPGRSSASASASSVGHPGAARRPNTSSSRSDKPTVRDVTCPPACIESGHLPHSRIRRGRGSSILTE